MRIDDVVTDLLLKWEDNPALTPEALCESYRGQPEHPALLGAVVRGMLCLRIAAPFLEARPTDEDGVCETPPTANSTGHKGQGKSGSRTPSQKSPEWEAAGLRYRPLAFHARGGLGEVFRAEDEELHREVALKRIQSRHQENPESRRRFLVEAEITSQLEHPGIVPVYGLGRDAEGNLCYAMRFIKGQTLDEALKRFHNAERKPGRDAAERGLALRELLNRFIAVCNTVAYAHSRGILHRDLKPANIILGNYGETLVVDWGLAKTFSPAHPDGQPHSTEATVLAVPVAPVENGTHAGRLMGTPAFMSPEQAHGRWQAVGPASDVFSLGATLYAVLTGQPPYQGQDREEVLDKARRVDFVPPRQNCPKLPRDLETICRKCMDEDPARRFPSAKALADDLERWLADEPVMAYREPLVQRGRRWLRKHRTLVGSCVAALLVTVVCLAGATVLLTEAYDQERLAKEQKQEQWLAATAAEDAARQSEAKAKSAQSQSDKVTEYLVAAFRSPDPRVRGSDLKVVNMLDETVAKLQKEPGESPLLKARLLAAIGQTYLGLKEGKKAVAVFEQERQLRMQLDGLDNEDTLTCMNNLASAYELAGRIDEAIVLFEKVLPLRKAKLGDEHDATLQSKNNLAVAYQVARRDKEAVVLLEEALKVEMAKFGPTARATLQGMNNLAVSYEKTGRLSDAVPLYEKTLNLRKAKLGEGDPDTLNSMNNLALAYWAANRFNEALPLFEQTLSLRKSHLGLEHPDTLGSMTNLAAAYQTAGRPREGLPLLEEATRLYKSKLGLDHPSTLVCMNNLANLYHAVGRVGDAIALHEETLRLRRSKLGSDHLETLHTLSSLAAAYGSAGRVKEAVAVLEDSLARRRASLGANHRETLENMASLAKGYLDLGRFKDAVALLENTLQLSKSTFGAEDPQTLKTLNGLANAYQRAGRAAEAVPLFEQTLKARQATLGADNPATLETMNDLGLAYGAAGRVKEGVALLEVTLKRRQATLGANHHDTLSTMNQLAVAYQNAGRANEGLQLLEEALKLHLAVLGVENRQTLTVMDNMAATYHAAGRLDDCLALLEKTAALRKTKFGAAHPATLKNMNDLGNVYLQASRPKDALEQFDAVLKVNKAKQAPEDFATAQSMFYAANAYLALGQPLDAEPLLRDCLAVREKKEPQQWTTYLTQAKLGICLLDQKRYADAEPLLLKAHAGMKPLTSKVTWQGKERFTELVAQIVQLYESTGQVDKAEKWREELAKAKQLEMEGKKL